MRRGPIVGGVAVVAVLIWFSATTWVWTQLDPTPLPVLSPPHGTTLSASSCRPCHLEIYDEWKASMMGQAMTDPAFVADFELQGQPFICLRCHAPLVEQQPRTALGLLSVKPLIPLSLGNGSFEAELQAEGVTCVVCHLEDGAMVGSLTDPKAPHPTRSGQVEDTCARCHQVEITPLSNLNRPITDTVREWERWKDETGRPERCIDCHIPHTWHGAWNDEMVRSGLVIDAKRDGDGVVVTLENRAGHNFPSGDPARALVVRSGETEVVLARRVPLPRLIDEGDSSLLPAEIRELRLPPGRIQVVFQRLRFLELGVDSDDLVLFDEVL